MAWRELENELYTGDEPADIIGKYLDDLADLHDPTWSFFQFLHEFLISLEIYAQETQTPFPGNQIQAGFLGYGLTIKKKYGSVVPHATHQAWMHLFTDLKDAYQKAWGRPPVIQEIMAGFSFVVRALPAGFFYDVDCGELLYVSA